MLSIFHRRIIHVSPGPARLNRGPTWSSSPSTRRHRASLGQDIYCSILVPVVDNPALGTSPFAQIKRKRYNDMFALIAGFGRREPSTDKIDGLPMHYGFCLEHRFKHRERSVSYALGEAAIRHHSSNVKVFEVDHVKPPDQAGCHFVQVVFSRICNRSIDSIDFQALSKPSSGSPLAFLASDTTGENALCFRKPLLFAPEEL